MDYYQGAEVPVISNPTGPLSRPVSPEPTPRDNSIVDSITSLMTMADDMELLLPPGISLDEQDDIGVPEISTSTIQQSPLSTDDGTSYHDPHYRFSNILPTIKENSKANSRQELLSLDSKPTPIVINHHRKPSSSVYPHDNSITASQVSCPLSTQSSFIDTEITDFDQVSLMKNSVSNSLPSGPSSITRSVSGYPSTADNTSPCSVKELNPFRNRMNCSTGTMQKIQKTTRKPKTYSKPVASRFCHICSRMPRRGQGSLTCRRMAEGLCRKIVCEQCLREQGWCYEEIVKNPNTWLCPHCAEVCPPRSQCHIYNRINARRKKVGSQNKTSSIPAALASSDLLLGPYSHLFSQGQSSDIQILQPPPNFKLNLPPSYSQL